MAPESSPAAPQNGRGERTADPTGRDRMAQNMASSWLSHFALIAVGFVLPRLIDRRIGQEALGVWDFAWSLIGYFRLVQGGVVSSVNRYVAKYRAVDDIDGVNRAVSSVSAVLGVMGGVVVTLTIGFAVTLPSLFGARLAGFESEAQWVVLWLGLSLSIQLASSGVGGVLTGCHRWDMHNAIHAGTAIATGVGMVAALLLGWGLIELAFVSFLSEAAGRVLRAIAAYRVCPGLQIRPRHARWSEAKRMMGFGGKTFVFHGTGLVMNQTANVLVLAYLGPAMLAVFSRPRALVRHMNTLVSKITFVLTPTASSMQAIDAQDEIRKLLFDSTRWIIYVSLPLVVFLLILGHPILHVWMGPAYSAGSLVLTILVIGQAATMIQMSARSILIGTNMHGWIGIAQIVASTCAILLVVLALGPLDSGLVGAAVALTVPLLITNGLCVPVYACRRLGIKAVRYYAESLGGPIACNVPFAACLAVASVFLHDRPAVALVAGMATGGLALGVVYWRFVLPRSIKQRVTRPLLNLRSTTTAEPRE